MPTGHALGGSAENETRSKVSRLGNTCVLDGDNKLWSTVAERLIN